MGKLYKLLLTDIRESMRDDSFEIDGIKYSWMSFEELEVDLNTSFCKIKNLR